MDMNISNVGKQCYGCMICSYVCGKKAIEIKLNNHGFYQPSICNDLCVGCGRCRVFCPALNDFDANPIRKTFYGYSKSESVRRSSSSGGAFFEIAKFFIKEGGVVYGCTAKDVYDVKHIRVDKVEDLKNLQGSKYVQSNTSLIYSEMGSDLKKGTKVLFSGTPCQIAAVKHAFSQYSALLFTIDLACYGFLSNGAFYKYLKSLETNHQSKVVSILFRDKEHDWDMKISFEDSSPLYFKYNAFSKNNDVGLYGFFLNRGGTKSACNECKFRCNHRMSDLTLSDYPYALSSSIDEDHKGVSVIYACTNKAFELMRGAELHLQESDRDLISQFRIATSIKTINRRAKIFQRFMEDSSNRDIKDFSADYDKAALKASQIKDKPSLIKRLKQLFNAAKRKVLVRIK